MPQIDEDDIRKAFLHMTSGMVDKDADLDSKKENKKGNATSKKVDLHLDDVPSEFALHQQIDQARFDLKAFQNGPDNSLEIITGKGSGTLQKNIISLIKSEFSGLKIVRQTDSTIYVKKKNS